MIIVIVNLDTGRELSDIDYAVSALLLLAIVSGIVYLMRKFFVKVISDPPVSGC